jgi:hypothetical protein
MTFESVEELQKAVEGLFAGSIMGQPRAWNEFVTLTKPYRYMRTVFEVHAFAGFGEGSVLRRDLMTALWQDFERVAEKTKAEGGGILVWRRTPEFEHFDAAEFKAEPETTRIRCRYGVFPLDLKLWSEVPTDRQCEGRIDIALLTGVSIPVPNEEIAEDFA